MKLYLAVFLMAGLVAVNSQDSLRCYNCKGNDCDNLSDNMLEACPAATSTTEGPPSETGSTPPENTSSTTTGPGSTPSGSTPPTTPGPGSTPSGSTPPTTPGPGSTPSGSTPPTTPGPGSTPSGSTPPTTPGSTPSESTPPTTPGPGSTPSGSTPPTTPGSTPSESTSSTTPGPGSSPSAVDVLIRNYRSVSRNVRADEPSYACYSIKYKKDDSDTQQRGCVKVEVDQSACDAIRIQLGVNEGEGDCDACLMDKCNGNGSQTLKVSLSALLTVILLKFSM